jgi:DNA-binding beta-propeller fold protein YncE
MRKSALPRLFILVAALLVLLGLNGCASSRLDDAAWLDKRLGVVWPQPPARARIRLLKVIQGPQDVVVKSSGVVGKLFDYIVGSEQDYLEFYTPQCMAADGNGLIYIADPSVGVIHVYNLATNEVHYIFKAGDKKLVRPVGVALDSEGFLYVTDTQLGLIFKLRRDGSFVHELDTHGKVGSPAGIAISSKNEKIVADMQSKNIYVFGADDALQRVITGDDIPGGFRMPVYVAVDAIDNVYVTDTMNFMVRIFDAKGKYLSSIGQIGDSPGSFARPKGVAVDSERNVYVMDSILANFQIFNQSGQLLLYVGQEGALPGEMMLPSGIFIDKNDRIYVSDTFNHRIQIYQYLKEDKTK